MPDTGAPEPATAAYARGHIAGELAGEISGRLTDHDRHFSKINLAMETSATELHQLNGAIQKLNLAVQGLRDENIAREARVIATALALRDADVARREISDQRWSPVAKIYATIATIATAVGLYVAITRR